MAYFLPSYIQKRLLRYALSRLELLDTDALDLESLEIAWSRRSTVELKDVGLRTTKLRSLLQLPDQLELKTARIALVKVTVPADIYTSSIVVEISGVVVQLRLSDTPRAEKPHGVLRHVNKHPDINAKSPGDADYQGQSDNLATEEDPNTGNRLPTAHDLATSFLHDESSEERQELEAAINTQSQILHQSTTSAASSEEDNGLGVGTGLALPNFLATFLKGIGDRLEVKIKDVKVAVDLELRTDIGVSTAAYMPAITSVHLNVGSIDVQRVNSEGETSASFSESNTSDRSNPSFRFGKRCIVLEHISGRLLFNPDLLSPAIGSPFRSPSKNDSFRHPESPVLSKEQSSHFEFRDSERLDGIHLEAQTSHLAESVLSDETGRFADVPDDDYSNGHLHSSFPAELLGISRIFEDHETQTQSDHFMNISRADKHHGLSNQQSSAHASGLYPSSTGLYPDGLYRSLQAFRDERRASSSLNSPRDLYKSGNPPLHLAPRYTSSELNDPRNNVMSGGQDAIPARRSPMPSDFLDSHDLEQPDHDEIGDFLESRDFSHEEAESLYLSTFSEQPPASFGSKRIPGGWFDDAGSSPNTTYLMKKAAHTETITEGTRSMEQTPKESFDDAVSLPAQAISSICQTVEANNPARSDDIKRTLGKNPDHESSSFPSNAESSSKNLESPRLSIELVTINRIHIYLPTAAPHATPDEPSIGSSAVGHREQRYGDKSFVGTIPGSFSQYAASKSSLSRADVAVDFEKATASTHESSILLPKTTANTSLASTDLIELEIFEASVQADIAVVRELWLLAPQILVLVNPEKASSQRSAPERSSSSAQDVLVSLHQLTCSFFDKLDLFSPHRQPAKDHVGGSTQQSATSTANLLFRTQVRNLKLKRSAQIAASTTSIEVGFFNFGYADEPILSFSRDSRARTSVRDLQNSSGLDFTARIVQTATEFEAHVSTLPVKLNFDIRKLDETLSCLGGFSGLMELGSSISSNTTSITGKARMQNTQRTVRFQSADIPPVLHEAQIRYKVNARLGGVGISLRGKDVYMSYQSTAVKFVGRDALFGVKIDHAQLSGPFSTHTMIEAPLSLQIHDLTFRFLLTPEEHDLTRLLSLLTPSQDKFEEEDDILVDTLLQQRKKGSVLRITISGVEFRAQDLERLDVLSQLGAELTKLSTVTKYLPEDDRPGILTLASIHQISAEVSVDSRIGRFGARLRAVEAAHVGLPSLMAVAIGLVHVDRNGELPIAHPSIDQSRNNCPPMLMARFVGDEVEPTAKFKLFNVCVEYNVPLIVSLLGVSSTSTTEEKIIDLANSITTLLASPKISRTSTQSTETNERGPKPSKPFNLDVALRECAIALQPVDHPSRGMVALTDVHIAGGIPTSSDLSVNVSINRASLLLIDDNDMLTGEFSRPVQRISERSLGGLQVVDLCRLGYVSVGTMSAAKAVLKQKQNEAGRSSFVDFTFQDALLVIETCADSTATLNSLFQGLQIPSQPVKGEVYRTEVAPIQDMMASVLLDAYGSSSSPLLFAQPSNLEEEAEYQDLIDSSHGAGEDFGDDEVPIDSSLFRELASSESVEAQERLLDSIIFQTRPDLATPLDVRLPRRYTTCLPDDVEEEFELLTDEDICIKPLKLPFASSAHKWDSARNRYEQVTSEDVAESPVKVSIRGLHVIWNLFDGYDWENTREAISEAVKDIENKVSERRAKKRRSLQDEEDKEPVIADFLFNSIYIGVNANRDDQDLRRRINHNVDDLQSETGSYASTVTTRPSGVTQPKRPKLKLMRSKRHKITFELRGVDVDVIMYRPGGETQSSIDIAVADLEIFDHVPTSTWRKFATYMHDAGVREEDTPMVHLVLCNVRPVPELMASELVIKATVQPLRLHVDQDALDFITRFFEFRDSRALRKSEASDEPYIQRIEVQPVVVKLDYKPKKVDYAGLRSGHTTEFMNFFILDGADILLKHAIVYGVRGFGRLNKDLDAVWMPDIRRNQLPQVLSGLTGVRSLIDVGIGIKDMIEVPIQEYRKDGRILRSIQKGALTLGKTTSEITRLGAKLATSAQTTLQSAEGLFSTQNPPSEAGWDNADLDESDKRATSNYADQPFGIMQGLRGAAEGLRREALLTKETIVAMSAGVLESESATAAASAIARHAPTIIFRPVIGASRAVSQTLMGATNSLDPVNRRRYEDKYKRY